MSRIAVVDSSLELLELLREALATRGWDTLTCSRAGPAFALVRDEQPDLVILDLWLDTPTAGWELLLRLRDDAATRSIPVIICSGEVRHLVCQPGWRQECGNRVLTKPFDLDDLFHSVETALRAARQTACLGTEGKPLRIQTMGAG